MYTPALEVLAHRVVWSVLFLTVLLLIQRRLPQVLRTARDPRLMRTLAASAMLVALNWLIFIWAVAHGQVLQASLGYFITPLLNVFLGYVFLHERLQRVQKVCVALAAAGVAWLLIARHELPAPALAMAVTFGLYGLVRKVARVDALTGLSIETGLLFVFALGYLLVMTHRGACAFAAGSSSTRLQLAAAGVITSVPLLFFAAAARRLRLATLGFLQYIAPTGQFLLAVLAYGEKFDRDRAICFACIWTALAIYSLNALRAARRSLNAG